MSSLSFALDDAEGFDTRAGFSFVGYTRFGKRQVCCMFIQVYVSHLNIRMATSFVHYADVKFALHSAAKISGGI